MKYICLLVLCAALFFAAGNLIEPKEPVQEPNFNPYFNAQITGWDEHGVRLSVVDIPSTADDDDLPFTEITIPASALLDRGLQHLTEGDCIRVVTSGFIQDAQNVGIRHIFNIYELQEHDGQYVVLESNDN